MSKDAFTRSFCSFRHGKKKHELFSTVISQVFFLVVSYIPYYFSNFSFLISCSIICFV